MTGDSLLRLGSRSSPLARAQAEWIASQLSVCPALVWVKSEGDQDRTTELNQFGGQGVFTAALHQALFDDRVDAAVHSLKDLPAGDEEGITLSCVPVREDQRDVLVARDGLTLDTLPDGARIGTGSPRRAAQMLRHRPDLRVGPLRGNVETRLRKLEEGEFDATLLALAGLRRLGLVDVVSEILSPDICLPAAGQGAIGITIRRGDARADRILAPLRDVRAAACASAERAALHGLGAGCHAPVGAMATVTDGRVHLRVRVLSHDGKQEIAGEDECALAEAADMGRRLAAVLLEQGAGPLVEAS